MPILLPATVARRAEQSQQPSPPPRAAALTDLEAKIAKLAEGGGDAALDKNLSRGKLLPRDRVQQLFDPGTPFLEH